MGEQITGFRRNHKTAGFDYLVTHEAVTRAALCRDLDISLPTAGKLVDAFLAGGLAVSLGRAETGPGRPAEAVALNTRRYIHAGVILEGHFLRIGLVDLRGDIVASRLLPCPALPPEQQITALIPREIQRLWQELALPENALAGICVGLPGVYDTESRTLAQADGLMDLGATLDRLAEECGCFVIGDNDANLCAVGELTSRDWPHMVYLSLGSTLGAAFILDRQLLRGVHYKAGRLEAIQVMGRNDPVPRRLDDILTRDALCRRFSLPEDTDFSRLDPPCRQAISDCIADYLGLFIADLGVLLDVDAAIIGGITAQELGESLIASLQTAVSATAGSPMRICPILTPDSDIIGAARLALRRTVQALLE